jgi:hypothetical protein
VGAAENLVAAGHGIDVESSGNARPGVSETPNHENRNAEESMTNGERDRLIEFLQKKMCGPCRRDGPTSDHEGCLEAHELKIVERDWT